ncbi:MAG: carboxylate--amine ligase [Pseudomonadota bacterium]
MFSYRRRRLLASSFKRALRWEFWPTWIFYIPVGIYIFLLTLRYRGLSFTAVNPGMSGSGFVSDEKSRSLLQLQAAMPKHVAATLLLRRGQPVEQQLSACDQFMLSQKLSYPIVAKPESGQRGIDVAIIDDKEQLRGYLSQAHFDSIIQEYVGSIEMGVFYYRLPIQNQGHIFSLTRKCFPSITGNGRDTLEDLILAHPRLHYMARFLLAQHRSELDQVPDSGEQVALVRLGTHSRGSLFLEGESYRSKALEVVIDQLSQSLPDFFFGRYDVRANDMDSFQKGDFKIIEVNGVTSESTNMYDPKYSVFTAYKIMFEQWRLAFVIGQQNIARGHVAMSFFSLLDKVRFMNRGSNINLP